MSSNEPPNKPYLDSSRKTASRQRTRRPAQTAAVSPASVEGARRLRAMKEVARGEPIALRAALPRPGELSACPRAGQSRCAVTSSCSKQPWVSSGPALAPFTQAAGAAAKSVSYFHTAQAMRASLLARATAACCGRGSARGAAPRRATGPGQAPSSSSHDTAPRARAVDYCVRYSSNYRLLPLLLGTPLKVLTSS